MLRQADRRLSLVRCLASRLLVHAPEHLSFTATAIANQGKVLQPSLRSTVLKVVVHSRADTAENMAGRFKASDLYKALPTATGPGVSKASRYIKYENLGAGQVFASFNGIRDVGAELNISLSTSSGEIIPGSGVRVFEEKLSNCRFVTLHRAGT